MSVYSREDLHKLHIHTYVHGTLLYSTVSLYVVLGLVLTGGRSTSRLPSPAPPAGFAPGMWEKARQTPTVHALLEKPPG
jgi:hypothetical protein